MPTYSVLNVAPQSAKDNSYQPAQRRKVTLDDHHQTWLVNYNEIREEVNRSTSYATADTIVYRNDYGNFAANQIALNSLVFGVADPNANGASAPVVFNANGIIINPPATLDVNGEASFSNITTFEAGSDTYFEGDLTANGESTFNGDTIFTGYVNFTPTSTLDVDGPSFFGAPMTITDDVIMAGDFDLTGDFKQTGNSVIDGNLEIGDDLLVRGNLTVLGDNVTLEIQNLVVEDKNIVVNKNDVFNNTFETGIWIQKGTVANAGYLQVSSYDEGRFEFKPPNGNKLTLEMPVKDVMFRLDDDFASDQALLTTSNVAFRTIVVDTSFGRHGAVPSVTQQNDPIAQDFGWISTPWVYTNVIESSDNLSDEDTTGIFMGASTFTKPHELSLVTYGEQRIYVDEDGHVGINTNSPVHKLHLSDEEPIFLISTDNYTEKSILALSDFTEDYDSSGMYLSFDTSTGNGLVEVTPFSLDTTFSVSVGGYEKEPELIVRQDKVTVDTDLYVTENGYVDKEFIVDNTLFVRLESVGVNVVNPTTALDVSGDIHGDSDLILDGVEPFVKIGTVTTLESTGRSGLVIEEETPIIQMSTNAVNYRHGSQLYWNDTVNERNWSIGSVNNGQYLDFGKSFYRGADTPEHGLDEYEGETLFRLNGGNFAEFYVSATNSTAGVKLNTRTNGVQLYLGEKPNVLSGERSTTLYGQNDFSSVIQWHGSTTTVGEIGYFPNGNDDGEFGSFRFSRTDGTVNQTVPSAKVGANQFFANDKIGISQTAPTAELHITKDVASALIETEDSDTFVRLNVNDSSSTASIRGEHVSGNSYFELSAMNPASASLVSQSYQLNNLVDHTNQEIYIELNSDGVQKIWNDDSTSRNIMSSSRDDMNYSMILDDAASKMNLILQKTSQVCSLEIDSDVIEHQWKTAQNEIVLSAISSTNQIKFELNAGSTVSSKSELSSAGFNHVYDRSGDTIELNGTSSNQLRLKLNTSQNAKIELKANPDRTQAIELSSTSHNFIIENDVVDTSYFNFGGTYQKMMNGSSPIYTTDDQEWKFHVDVRFEEKLITDGEVEFNDVVNFSPTSDVTVNGDWEFSPTSDVRFKGITTFDTPIYFNHNQPLMFYDQNSPTWILKDENVESGLYWNDPSNGGSYSFVSTTTSQTTVAEDPKNQFVFVFNGTPKAAIDTDTGSFRAKGDVIADNDVIGYSTSDKKYKDNVKEIDSALNKIDKIRGVEFDWKENPSGYMGHDVGVIAQEIEEILPEVVRVGSHGQKQVNYEKLVPLLIQCIKELKEKIG